MKQHKWHKEIKAWADGAEIEFKVNGEGDWTLLKGTPYWECENDLFRIKPQPKEPQYLYAYLLEIGEQAGNVVFGLDNSYIEGFSYIGKIKLEVEE
jgi:hypothetical protein